MENTHDISMTETTDISEKGILLEAEQHEFKLFEGVQNDEKFFYIRGRFATIETLNGNKRIYPRNLWEREVAKYQSEIENGTINTLMEWEHPDDRLDVNPKNAVAKITKLWIEGDHVMGEAVIFDTPQAETLKSMIRHGVKISVSSRARGKVGAGNIVKEFNLITFDIVTKPSDSSATMDGIFEADEYAERNSQSLNNLETNLDNHVYGAVMKDEIMMENLIEILRTKNVEIRDLNEEISLLKDNMSESSSHDSDYVRELENDLLTLKESFEQYKEASANSGSLGTEEYEIILESLWFRDREIVRLAEQLEAAGIPYAELDRGFGSEYNPGMLPTDRYGHRHQDVSSTLDDTDDSGYYASGEREYPEIKRRLENDSDTDEGYGDIHSSTYRDARIDTTYTDFEPANNGMVTASNGIGLTESTKKRNRFTSIPSHLI